MFRQKGKTTAVSDAIGGIAPLAEEVMEDKKLRGRLIAAASHGLAARRQARSRGRLRQLALNRELHAQVAAMATQLERANKRRLRKRRNRKLVRSAFFAVPVAAVAVPQSRTWIREQLGGAKDATGSLAGSISLPRGGQMRIEEQLDLDVPVSTAYNQWTQFEEFPFFMEGVDEVQQLDDETLRWVASIGGQRAEWEAKIVEQVPDQRIVWETKDGKETRGSVGFEPLDSSHSRISLTMTYTPEGVLQKVGSAAGLDARRVRGDLQRFKELIESRGTEDGAWRGEIENSKKA